MDSLNGSLYHRLSFSFAIAVTFQLLTHYLEKKVAAPLKVEREKKRTVYYNIVASLIHSTISSVGCLYCFHIDPNLTSNIVNPHSDFAMLVASFSWGYFLHDLIHFAKHYSLFSNGGIVIHHVVVVFCFGLAVVQQHFVNYVIVALLCEVNSVFLHVRQLLHMAGYPHKSYAYRLNSLVNILTYVLFRICTLTWMFRWLVLQEGVIPYVFHTIGVVGMSVMTIVNVILFARLLSKDYWPRVARSPKADSLKSSWRPLYWFEHQFTVTWCGAQNILVYLFANVFCQQQIFGDLLFSSNAYEEWQKCIWYVCQCSKMEQIPINNFRYWYH